MSIINQITATKDRIVEVIRIDATQLPDECITEINQIIDDYPIISVTKSRLVLYKLNEKILTSQSCQLLSRAITARDVQIPTFDFDVAIINALVALDEKITFHNKYILALDVYKDYIFKCTNRQLLVDACMAIGIDTQQLCSDSNYYIYEQIRAVAHPIQNEIDQANTTLQTLQTNKMYLEQANAEVTRLQTLQSNRDQKADQFNQRTTKLIALLQTPRKKQREKIMRYKCAIVKALHYNRSYMDMKEKIIELLETYWSDTNVQHTVVEFGTTFNNHDEEIAHFEMLCDYYIKLQNVDNSNVKSISGFNMASYNA